MVYNKYGPLIRQMRKASYVSPEEILGKRGFAARKPEGLVTLDTASKYFRNPIYRAERRVHRSIRTPWTFYSPQEVQDYVNGVSIRAAEKYSKASFPVQVRQGEPGQASYNGGIIVTPFPVRQLVILHELAHHLAGQQATHDQFFMGAYLYLLRLEMGEDITQRLLDNLQSST